MMLEESSQTANSSDLPPNNQEKKTKDISSIMYTFFNGRLNRMNYILGHILLFVLSTMIGSIIYLIETFTPPLNSELNDLQLYFLTMFKLFPIVLLVLDYILFTTIILRRMHDTNMKTPKISLFPFAVVWAFIMLFVPGNNESNQYGKPQKGISLRTLLGLN